MRKQRAILHNKDIIIIANQFTREIAHFSASLIFCVTKVIKPNFLTYLTLLVHITYEFK